MNFTMLVICFSINIIISIGIPIGVLVYIIAKRRVYLKSYLIGALIFFLSQIVLRLPILNFLSTNVDSYIMLSSFYPIVYSIILGLSAGVFEEVGRFLGFKLCLKKNRTYKDGLAFGIGHGGIEAILITGISSISNLIAVISLHNGSFNSVNYGMTAEKAMSVYSSLTGFQVLIGGFERLFAMCIHIGITMMVLYGINKRQKRYLLFAIIIHGIVDSMLGILQYFGVGLIGIEVWVMICAIVSVIYTIKCKGKFELVG
ncbi:YhfC family glutamic-type intramembrane protease [Clostridioides difficile]